MHAQMQIGDSRFMLSDAVQNAPAASSHLLYVADCDAAFKRAVDAGMTVKMPLADRFWGDRYGLVEDQFGNRWAFATHNEDVSPDEMKKRMAALMAKK